MAREAVGMMAMAREAVGAVVKRRKWGRERGASEGERVRWLNKEKREKKKNETLVDCNRHCNVIVIPMV